jgi:hypothetical protein
LHEEMIKDLNPKIFNLSQEELKLFKNKKKIERFYTDHCLGVVRAKAYGFIDKNGLKKNSFEYKLVLHINKALKTIDFEGSFINHLLSVPILFDKKICDCTRAEFTENTKYLLERLLLEGKIFNYLSEEEEGDILFWVEAYSSTKDKNPTLVPDKWKKRIKEVYN